MNKNLEFLTELDKKLRSSHRVESGFYRGAHYDEYADKKMSEEEAEKVLNISQEDNFVIYPVNTAMGFSVGYNVCIILPTKKLLLRFRESQLPKGYTFDKMAETFMSKANLAKASMVGEKIRNDYDAYSY